MPIVGHDGHLPAVELGALDAAALARRLARAHEHAPERPGDGSRFEPDAPWREASVLVPLRWSGPAGWQVLLTLRTAHLRDHAGQIAFPGGGREPTDADAAATALREAEEEIGLPPVAVTVIGTLAPYRTVTGFVVTPVVGIVRHDGPLHPDPHEVAEVFEVPLAFLMTPAHHRRHRFEESPGGASREFLSMPWTGDGHGTPERYIWGATAAMLRNLYAVLAQQPAEEPASPAC